MLATLRRRLVLSHVLPLLVISPLIGLTLVYVLETQVLLPNLSNEMKGQALLVAQLAAEHNGIWGNAAEAKQFVASVAPDLTARVMLLDANDRLLASSDTEDVPYIGQRVTLPATSQLESDKVSVITAYSRDQQAEVADVIVPVTDSRGRLLGVVRVTHRLASVYEWFLRLRYLIALVLAAGVLAGAILGSVLAISLSRPLRAVTDAVSRLAGGQQTGPIPEEGPEEVRMLSRAFNSLTEQLRSLEKARRQLLANLVHELARPMGALLSALQALQRGAVEDAELRQELLAGMEEELVRMQRLVDNLAQLHDRVLGAPELVRRSVPLTDWLRRTLAPWGEAARDKGVTWKTIIPDQLPSAEIDPDRLAQALGNLVSNAIKYTPSGGSVAISVETSGGSAYIWVTDSGPGIRPEERAQVFTPFFRGSQSGRFPQGMGLGLAIARDLVLAHGGQLELETRSDPGAQFLLRFPVNPQ